MQIQEQYSEEVFEILREFLPQIEKEMSAELDSKYKTLYEQKYRNEVKILEQSMNKKIEDQVSKLLKQKQYKLKQQYDSLYQQKIMQLESFNDEALKRFKIQIQSKKQFEGSKEKHYNVLLLQKANWEKLQKQYQRTIRQIGKENISKIQPSNIPMKSNEKEKKHSFISSLMGSRQNSSSKTSNTKSKMNFCTGLKIQIGKDKEAEGSYSQIESGLYKKDDISDDYQSLLSPPNVLEKQQQQKGKSNLKQKRSVFWKQEKKKELLSMIRKKIF